MEQESLEIARGLKHRDPDLLDRLIERYQYRLLRYLISLVGRRETAEDLFQETWIRVLEKGKQYNGKTKFPPVAERMRFPWWLIALAVVGFLGVQALVHFATLSDPPPLGVRIFLLPFAGLVVAFYILVAGYVNRDAKRRGMNSLVWTLLVIFIPNAIGFIIYFLTRRPVLLQCPQCSTHIEAGFTYCPRCSYKLTPTCPKCDRSVTITDVFCPYCGKALEATPPAEPVGQG
jgi:hypothetical protein